MQTVGMIGLGALGVLFGQRLMANGADVRVLADKTRAEKYQKQGVTCNGAPVAFRYVTPEEAEPVDLMIFATKEGGLRGAMETAAGFIGENTLVLSVLNGVSSEEILAERFGETNILYCTAQGVTAKPVGDMVRRQWGKLMLNVGLNQTVMVFEGDYGTVQQPGKPRDIMIAAMREVQKLAAMEGYPISDEEFDDWVKLADSLSPAGKPSMRQDGEAHRKSEVELFAGTIIRRAARFGLDVPVNRWLYDTVKKMEAAY